MSELHHIHLAAIRQKPPHEALQDLIQVETAIRQSVHRSKSAQKAEQMPPAVPVVEWLGDQIVFLRAAWEWLQVRKLSDEDTVWLLEMLSLPECWRRTLRKWQRTRLLDEALLQSNLHWRDVLSCRQRTDRMRHIPRTGAFQFYPRQLGPYQSPCRCPKRWPNPWKLPFDFFLTIKWPGAEGGSLLQPLLSGSSFSFTIELRTLTGSVFLDVPRDYNGAECIRQLQQLRSCIDQCVVRDQTDSALRSAEPEPQEYVGLLGRVRHGPAPDVVSLRQQWRAYAANLERDIARLRNPKLRRAQRAAILQTHFMIAATMSLKPIHLLPLDLSIDVLPLVVSAWMMERDLLSFHERRTVKRYVVAQLLQRNGDMTPSQAQRLVREVIQRLGNFARPLGGDSIRAYLRQVVRREAPAIQHGLCDNVTEMDEIEGEAVEDSALMESVKPKGQPRSRLMPAKRRVPRGSLLRQAQRVGCHPKTIARRYQRYCREKRLIPSADSWRKYRRYTSRLSGQD